MNTDYEITPDGILTGTKIGLKIAILPETVKMIEPWAFRNCKDTLEQLIIQSKLKIIKSCTFSDFKKLNSINIMHGVESIEDFAFYNCPELHSVIIKKHLRFIGDSCFENCVKLPFISILDSVEYISDNAYKNCIKLEAQLPRNVGYIGDDAFLGCKLIVEKYNFIEEIIRQEQQLSLQNIQKTKEFSK